MRRPVICAPRLVLELLEATANARGTNFEIELLYKEGEWVGAGEPMIYLTGSFLHLVDLETIYLQKLGPACVAAYNAYTMCVDLPKTAFLAMDARHCAGRRDGRDDGLCRLGRLGRGASARSARSASSATPPTRRRITSATTRGVGTMPHALIGYAGSTVRAAEMFHETFPDEPLTVLVDYFGREITRRARRRAALSRARRRRAARRCGSTPMAAAMSRGSTSRAPTTCWSAHAPQAIRGYRTEGELRYLVGTGVSAAAIWHLRQSLDAAGFPTVKIVASSGFSPAKCHMMAMAKAPIDVVGTGSYLPENWTETYATADIVAYDDKPMVKLGREFLLRQARDAAMP